MMRIHLCFLRLGGENFYVRTESWLTWRHKWRARTKGGSSIDGNSKFDGASVVYP